MSNEFFSQRKLIARYVLAAALPYFILSLALLTAILMAQQSERFAELALYAQLPFSLLGQIEAALIPNVLVFTLPMALLAAVMIGFARMGSDSEIVAMRAAGVGTWTMLWPVLFLGLIVTAGSLYINMKEAPQAARGLRRAAILGALRKLDSPVEPRTFTTEIPGYVIYVRDGNKVEGIWGRVFIFNQLPDGASRILTARSGRIDTSADKSELVLRDAVLTQVPGPATAATGQYVAERSEQFRIAFDTGRSALLTKLDQAEPEPDEMEWSDLRKAAAAGKPRDMRDAQRMLQKRLAFSFSPLVFALLGGALGLRVRRGGRGIGVLLSLGMLIAYYLVFLLGESLSRVGTVSPFVGAWMATAFMLLLSFAFLRVNRHPLSGILARSRPKNTEAKIGSTGRKRVLSGARHWGFPSLLDSGMLRTLFTSFVLGFISLVSIFIIFTLFELWRFIALNKTGIGMVAKYLLFLLPLVTVELFPATMLIAVLVTYALLAKRSEAIAWWACGQSVYRLMLPGLLFGLLAAAGIWLIQEKLMPPANVRQDSLRAAIRGGAARAITGTGRQWLGAADSNRLYSYEYDEQHQTLRDFAIYDFDSSGVHLEKVTTGEQGRWRTSNELTVEKAETITIRGLEVAREQNAQLELRGIEAPQIFKPTVDKPSQLSSRGLSDYLKSAKRRGMDVSALAVALQRKYSGPLSVMVMAFLGIPLALSFGRRGTVIALCSAVAVSLAYWGVSGGFQQLGNHGLLPPPVAGWAPPVIFAAAGTYFLARIRT
ncbi:MAG: putative permease [Acidobacteria bacterium]|nr:putative permease [Acidobacteriota bacterium]